MSSPATDPSDEDGIWIEWRDTCGSGEVIRIQLAPVRPERPVRPSYLRAAYAARNGVRVKHVERLD